jgi:hypothetical protein
MWYERRRPLQPAVPVVKKTPEQLAEELAEKLEKARLYRIAWDETNPPKKYRVAVFNTEPIEVNAHYFHPDQDGRALFYRKIYQGPYIGSERRELVFWASSHQIRFVQLIEE